MHIYFIKANPDGYGGFLLSRPDDRGYVPVSMEDVKELGATTDEITQAQSGKRVMCRTTYGGDLDNLVNWFK